MHLVRKLVYKLHSFLQPLLHSFHIQYYNVHQYDIAQYKGYKLRRIFPIIKMAEEMSAVGSAATQVGANSNKEPLQVIHKGLIRVLPEKKPLKDEEEIRVVKIIMCSKPQNFDFKACLCRCPKVLPCGSLTSKHASAVVQRSYLAASHRSLTPKPASAIVQRS